MKRLVNTVFGNVSYEIEIKFEVKSNNVFVFSMLMKKKY